MTRCIVATVAALVFVSTPAVTQPRPPIVLDQSAIKLESNGNELIVMREAPVAYSTLEQISTGITTADTNRAAPVRVIRASPPQAIDYLLCVTNGGTLVLGERVHTREAGEHRYVFARGAIVRSYPSLTVPEGWLWLVEVPLSREGTVTLQLRAPAQWPLAWVSVTTVGVP